MISTNLQKLMNDQIVKELFSSNLYLAMSAHFEAASLRGFGHWMRLQAAEEYTHAMKFYDYLLERGGTVVLGAIDAPVAEFGPPVAIFEEAYAHEQKVTASIHAIYAQAVKEADFAAQSFLDWFVTEQVEEEANAQEIVERLRLGGDSGAALLMLDAEMKGRE
jgi:ferritin